MAPRWSACGSWSTAASTSAVSAGSLSYPRFTFVSPALAARQTGFGCAGGQGGRTLAPSAGLLRPSCGTGSIVQIWPASVPLPSLLLPLPTEYLVWDLVVGAALLLWSHLVFLVLVITSMRVTAGGAGRVQRGPSSASMGLLCCLPTERCPCALLRCCTIGLHPSGARVLAAPARPPALQVAQFPVPAQPAGVRPPSVGGSSGEHCAGLILTGCCSRQGAGLGVAGRAPLLKDAVH